MAISVAQRELLMKKFDALATILKEKMNDETVAHNSGTYRLFVRVSDVLSNLQDDNDTEAKVSALIEDIAKSNIDLGEIAGEVGTALQTVSDTFSAPGGCKSFWKAAWHKTVSCCCVCSSSIATVLGPVGREIAIQFVNLKIEKMDIPAAAKAAMKSANKAAITAAVGGFISTLDHYAEEHRQELRDNVYISQAVEIMGEVDLLELLPDGTVSIAGQEFNTSAVTEDIFGDFRAELERSAKIDDDEVGAAKASVAAATAAHTPANFTQAQLTALQKAAAMIAENRDAGTTGPITKHELQTLRHTMKSKLETDALDAMHASRTGLHKKLAAELRKVDGLESLTDHLARELLHNTFGREMENMGDVVSSISTVRNLAMRWKLLASGVEEEDVVVAIDSSAATAALHGSTAETVLGAGGRMHLPIDGTQVPVGGATSVVDDT